MSMLGMEPDRPYGEEALALYESLGDRVAQSRALNNLAVLAWIQGRGTEALDMFRRAQVVATEAGDTVGAAETDYNIGDVLLRLGRAGEAESLLRGLVPVLQALGAEGFLASARRALAMALVLEGDVVEGQRQLGEARVLFTELGEPAEVAETDGGIAMGLLAAGEAQAASDLAADAVGRAIALDAGYLLPWLLRIQGAAQSDLGQLDEAESTLLLALEVANSHSRVERGFILAELATLAGRMSDPAEATLRELESTQAFDELGFVGSRRYPRSGPSVVTAPEVAGPPRTAPVA
jgi:tetratricopeptide (TPR) repeat protein